MQNEEGAGSAAFARSPRAAEAPWMGPLPDMSTHRYGGRPRAARQPRAALLILTGRQRGSVPSECFVPAVQAVLRLRDPLIRAGVPYVGSPIWSFPALRVGEESKGGFAAGFTGGRPKVRSWPRGMLPPSIAPTARPRWELAGPAHPRFACSRGTKNDKSKTNTSFDNAPPSSPGRQPLAGKRRGGGDREPGRVLRWGRMWVDVRSPVLSL